MLLAVLDTSVIVSACISDNGAPAKIVMDWVMSGIVQTVTSPRVASEYREVVRRAKFHRYPMPPLWLETLIEQSVQISDRVDWPYPCPDPKDTPFLALAHDTGAWLITGNLKHFPETIRNGVKVLAPADYLSHLIGNI